MKYRLALASKYTAVILLTLAVLAACSHPPASVPIPTSSPALPSQTPTSPPTPSPTATLSPTLHPPLTIVFYGDSLLAIGSAGDGLKHVGFSFVDNLKTMLDPAHTLVTANYGGRTAKWAYENLKDKVLPLQPDLVSLWWGFNDLGGCPGNFDPETNAFLKYKTEAIVGEHIRYMRLLIDDLLEKDVVVFVMTPVPIMGGQLPWSHLDENYRVVWEENRWCNFNQAMELLVLAQRDMVAQYQSSGKKVFLVDVWQTYLDNPNTDKMYMDVIHPASVGARLIAERWLEVFETSRR